ncbi:hypothetical protein Hanom_Chr10g00875021 [Helianthus anomalus]
MPIRTKPEKTNTNLLMNSLKSEQSRKLNECREAGSGPHSTPLRGPMTSA